MSKKAFDGVELISTLDPYLFETHGDVVSALFEVYKDLSAEY